MWPKTQFSSIFASRTILFFFLIDYEDLEWEMKISGKMKSFPILMKIGGSERSNIEM